MLVKKTVEGLLKTKEYTAWKEKHPQAFLAHVLIMVEPGVEHRYDIGFYDEKKNKMTSFLTEKTLKQIEVTKDQEVFKDPQHKIKKLDMSKVSTGYEVAIELARDVQKTKYKEHAPIKEVVLLQNIKEGQVWNITYVTKTFKTLNIKVSSEKDEVVSDKLIEIFQMG